MASKKPLTQTAGLVEQLQSVDTLTVGTYDLPNTISDDGKALVTVNSAAVWEYYSHGDLTGITTDQHHAKSHTHNGADGSGVVEHDDTANGTIASHDTSATGAELDTLTDGSNADSLHEHDVLTLSGNVTYYVATTGNDSTGTGNIASPWSSISRALDEVNLYRFDKDAVATIELAAGQYEMRTVPVKTSSIPYLVIQGATRYQYDITAVTAVASIGSGIYDITFTVNTTTGMSTSDFLAIRTLVSGRIYNGAWEIRDVISGTSVKIRIDSPLITPGTGAMSNVDGWVMPTVIETRDANGFNLHWDHVQVTNLTFKKGADGVNAMDVNGVSQIHIGPYVACNGYVDGSGVASWGAYCELDYVFISDSWLALWPRRGGGMYVLDTCLGGNVTGVQTYGAAVNFDGVLMAGNSFAGVSAYQGGTYRSVDSDYVGGGFAVWANSESFAHVTAADGNTFASNTTNFSPAANTEGNLNSYMKA
jgi:hypothetical protein